MSFRDRVEGWFRRPPTPRPPASSANVDRLRAAAVVDLALRAAELAVKTGAVTAEATAFALTVTSAYGLACDVDVTWNTVTISYHRKGRAEPITGFRSVRARATNYTVLTRLMRLMDEVGERRLSLEEARERLDELRMQSRPYRNWVICGGQALLGAGVAALLGGRPMEIGLAALANALLFLVQLALARTQLSVFFLQAIGAAVPTAMAVAVMHVRATAEGWFLDVSPSLIVAAGIVSMLAGVGVVAAARDAMEGNLLTATARTFDAVLQTSGIVLGVVVTLWAGFKLGVEGYIAPTAGVGAPSAIQIALAAVCAVGSAFGFQTGLTALPFCAGLAAIGWATYMWALEWVGNWAGAAGLGAMAVGFFAQFVVGRWRIPLIALVTTGIVSMMPGSALYRGLYEAIRSYGEPLSAQAQINLSQAVMVALSLAAGSTLGAQLARPLGLPTARFFRLAVLRTIRRSHRVTANTEAGAD